MKERIKDIIRPLKYWTTTLKLFWPYLKFTEINLASFGISKSREKMRSYILMQVHIIEKGLSLADVKPWFGQPKINALIDNTYNYFTEYKDIKILYIVTSTIFTYLEFNKGKDGTPGDIIRKYNDLKSLLGDYLEPNLEGGIEYIKKNSNICFRDYNSFVASRHSVRSFTGEAIDENLLCKALKIAETTPSACNRQPWYNYVVIDKQKIIKILSEQGGSRQFKDQVSALIITTSSSHFFFQDEFNQMFFNTGLYSMNLLLALHSLGLGTIPLNMGINSNCLDSIRGICNIPNTEMPISLIAIGILPDEYKIARSPRFSFNDYTKFI